jgi:hypothetical protein
VSKVYWRRKNRPSTFTVHKYSNVDRWLIKTSGPLPYPDSIPNWDTCPGTLYQDYDTEQEAIEVALWWGYQKGNPRNVY